MYTADDYNRAKPEREGFEVDPTWAQILALSVGAASGAALITWVVMLVLGAA